jgi:hypothetical protein
MTTLAFDMADTRVVLIDADPATVLSAVERLGLGRTVLDAVESLGVGDRIALAPTPLAAAEDRERVYGMAWRVDGGAADSIAAHELATFERPGYVKVTWEMRIEAGGDSGTILSTRTRFVATDASSRERLATAWAIVGPLSAALSKRALAAVKLMAEEELGRSQSGTIDIPVALRHGPGLALAA